MKISRSLPRLVRHGCYWLLVYAAVWAVLSGAKGWLLGVPCVLAAAGLSLWLQVPRPVFRLIYLPRFLYFFVYETLLGAWDVATRAFHPQLPLDPAWVTHRFECTDARVRLLLSAMVGLMPGTLSTHIDGDILHLHVLDQQQDWRSPIAQMELHLARLLGALPT